jgi:hypothetical protein
VNPSGAKAPILNILAPSPLPLADTGVAFIYSIKD